MTTFEQRLARLEEIAAELDGEQLDLSRALELFEEGIENLRAASEDVARAEARVQRLVEKADRTFELDASDD